MVDREKVIKGLECLSSEEVWPPENTVAYFEKTGERLKEIYTQYHDRNAEIWFCADGERR